jgi:hypothetical protein
MNRSYSSIYYRQCYSQFVPEIFNIFKKDFSAGIELCFKASSPINNDSTIAEMFPNKQKNRG